MLRQLLPATTLAAAFALATTAPPDLTPPDSRKAVPHLALTASNGKPIKLSAYKGRVVLLDFWATWCEGCKDEIPWFMEFQNKYKKSGLSGVGVSLDDDGWKSVTPYLHDHKINYLIVVGSWESAKQFGVDKGMPVTVLIDRTGKIADVHAGVVDKASFEAEIQALLKENSARSAD